MCTGTRVCIWVFMSSSFSFFKIIVYCTFYSVCNTDASDVCAIKWLTYLLKKMNKTRMRLTAAARRACINAQRRNRWSPQEASATEEKNRRSGSRRTPRRVFIHLRRAYKSGSNYCFKWFVVPVYFPFLQLYFPTPWDLGRMGKRVSSAKRLIRSRGDWGELVWTKWTWRRVNIGIIWRIQLINLCGRGYRPMHHEQYSAYPKAWKKASYRPTHPMQTGMKRWHRRKKEIAQSTCCPCLSNFVSSNVL